MDSLLHRLLATWTRSQEGSPRRHPTATVRCESLEDRQLLSTMSLLKGNATPPFSPGTQRALFSTRGSWVGQDRDGSGADSVFARAGESGNTRADDRMFDGGATRGGIGGRNGLAGRMIVQRGNGNPMSLAVDATADPNASAVPVGNLATETTLVQADPASGVVATTNGDGDAQTTGEVDNAVPSTPSQDWRGWSGTEPVMFRTAPGELVHKPGVHGDFMISDAGPSEAATKAFDKLHTDLQAIQDKSEVTPKLLAAVRKDGEAIWNATTADPDQAALETLATNVQSIDGQIPTDEQRAQLVADFTAVLKSQGITDQALIDKTITDIQAVVAASNVTADDLATIAADREAIQTALAAEAESNPPATPMAGDPVGSLFAGLSGDFVSGVPTVFPYLGGGMGGGFGMSPALISSASQLPDGGFHTLPAMDGEFHTLPAMDGEFHTLPAMDGGFQTLPAMDGEVHTLPAMDGEFHTLPAVDSTPGDDRFTVSSAGVGAGGQLESSSAATTVVGSTDKGMGGKFSGSPTKVSYVGGMNRRFSKKVGGGMAGSIGGPWGRYSPAKGRSFRA